MKRVELLEGEKEHFQTTVQTLMREKMEQVTLYEHLQKKVQALIREKAELSEKVDLYSDFYDGVFMQVHSTSISINESAKRHRYPIPGVTPRVVGSPSSQLMHLPPKACISN